MLFNYTVVNQNGAEEYGSIDAVNMNVAVSSLQRRGFIISSIAPAEEKTLFAGFSTMFEGVSTKELVMLSNQISILFTSHVSVLRVFRLLAESSPNPVLQKALGEISDDIQGGESLSNAMAKHPAVFSEFYVNMVKSGEESGNLSETFSYLSEYMERSYEIISKTKNALVYPAFVVATFVAVMVTMLTLVIPKLSAVLIEAGAPIPGYTKVVIALSEFTVNYGLFFGIFLVIAGLLLWQVGLPGGKTTWSAIKLKLPLFGNLFTKTYLSRISDNLDTLLSSGVPMLRSIEITASVVGDDTYKGIMMDVADKVKSGTSLSEALSTYQGEIPNIMIQMIKVGEETGELATILKTLAKFYKREVDSAIDTLVSLIEPIMIVSLAVGVGFLLASVLIPIYNVTSTIT